MSADVKVEAATRRDVVVLTVQGLLNGTTYRELRDRIIKAALDVPAAVVVDVTALQVPAESAWAVFTSARWHVCRWPEVPILLVCRHAAERSAIRRNGVSRYVPVYEDADQAVAAGVDMRPPRYRQRARVELSEGHASLHQSRQLVEHWLGAWSQHSLVSTAKVVVTAFVENVLLHAETQASLRLESDGTVVTVAVEDANRMPAGVREVVDAAAAPTGLKIVSALCRAWGNAPTPNGKTVWAVLGPENAL